MQIDHLLVDEITINRAHLVGVVNSTLYDFREPQWVSTHRERIGHQIGPITLLKENPNVDEDWLNITARSFGERRLPTSGSPANLIVSYKDDWTIPDLTLYVLMLPKYYVARNIKFSPQARSETLSLQTGSSQGGHLFLYSFFGDWKAQPHVFQVELRVEKDEQEYLELVKSVDTVEATDHFKRFRGAVGKQVSTPDFWFKLIELGAKLVGR